MSIEHGVNFIELAAGQEQETLASAAFVAVVVLLIGLVARARLASHDNPLVPDSSLTIHNLLELITSFIRSLGDNVMGEHNRRFLPFACTLFIYLLFMNILGLVPGFSMPTDDVSFNLGIALTVFVLYNFWGVKEVGVVNYLKHLWGPIFLLGFMLFPIELISHFVRPLSLSLRLYGNMTGDHVVLSIFTNMTEGTYIPLPVVFYFLGMFVCFMQAFVFTLLTMIYIRFAVAHDESH